MKATFVSFLFALFAGAPAYADWVLNSDASALSFVSTKAVNLAEVHSFATLEGTLNENGAVRISIDLASVNTGLELRDDRMREMLFETGSFSSAVVTANVDETVLSGLAVGEPHSIQIDGQLALHGQTASMTFEVIATNLGESGLMVVSSKPVVISAPTFGLAEGVERLREIAGLPSISAAVPVSFVLVFESD